MVLCFFSFGIIPALFSQDTIRHMVVPGKIINGDTIPYVDMKNVVVLPPMDIKTLTELVGYGRLVYNVKKVYPYAKIAAAKLTEYEHVLDSIPTEKGRRKFLKVAEKDLKARFENEIKDLNFTQGKILIKLVYRQTGNSTFDIVRELRGSFNAFIYQTLARIFGYDLKSQYDPEGSDKAIEHIVQLIDEGTL